MTIASPLWWEIGDAGEVNVFLLYGQQLCDVFQELFAD